MKWFVYNIFFAIAYTLMMPRFIFRMCRRGGYRKGFLQRLGRYDDRTVRRLAEKARIWIHAVSVGEVYIALKFMDELRRRYEGAAFVLSTTTSTGHKIAENGLDADDVLLYFPTDFPSVVRRVLNLVQPKALILTECELWPNLIRTASRRNIPVILINGRISESSYKGYKSLKPFFGEVLSATDLFLVQTDREGEMLTDLGVDPDDVRIMGTAKYDVARSDPEGARNVLKWLDNLGVSPDDPIIVGGSTWRGEESVLLDIFEKLREDYDGLRLILVPRHAERRGEVEELIRKRGLEYVKRSAVSDQIANMLNKDECGAGPEVILIDTTGELMGFYACASVIFVGKSLNKNHGGQNIIEPALLGKPVIVGPNMENFPVVASDFLSEDAIIQVDSAKTLESAIISLLGDENKRNDYGRKAGMVVKDKQGVVEESVDLILPLLD